MISYQFYRQQERHLGIIKSLDASTARKKHDVHSFLVNNNSSNSILNQSSDIQFNIESSMVALEFGITSTVTTDQQVVSTEVLNSTKEAIKKSAESLQMYPVEKQVIPNLKTNLNIEVTKLNGESWILAAPTVILKKRDINNQEKNEETKDLIDIPLEIDGNGTLLFKREIIRPEQQPPVQVRIQNITEVKINYIQILSSSNLNCLTTVTQNKQP